MINVCAPEDTVQRTKPTAKQRKKNKWFRKRMQYLETKGYVEGKQKYNHYKHDQTPCQNGAFTTHPQPAASTQTESVPRLVTTASTSHSSSRPSASTHSMPSLTVTVNNIGSHEKPKEPVNTKSAAVGSMPAVSGSHKPSATPTGIPTKYLAIDCEMVGTGPKGRVSQLARCSIVSYDGDVVYDKFINPSMPVTDYRTRWSGIRRCDLIKATPYSEARKEILKLLMGKVVIGHAIHNDFKALGYSHPAVLTRDTSRISLLNLKAGFAENECASLKRLTKAIFNRDIQSGKKGHSSVEDAKATMDLYKVVEEEWERKLLLQAS